MKTKFTKGPWINEDWSYEITTKECSLPIAKVTVFNEAKANAHLIAAAPAMYEMIERLICNYQIDASVALQEGYESRYLQDAELVKLLLAKARGEQYE